jgi:hypothetical protein
MSNNNNNNNNNSNNNSSKYDSYNETEKLKRDWAIKYSLLKSRISQINNLLVNILEESIFIDQIITRADLLQRSLNQREEIVKAKELELKQREEKIESLIERIPWEFKKSLIEEKLIEEKDPLLL